MGDLIYLQRADWIYGVCRGPTDCGLPIGSCSMCGKGKSLKDAQKQVLDEFVDAAARRANASFSAR